MTLLDAFRFLQAEQARDNQQLCNLSDIHKVGRSISCVMARLAVMLPERLLNTAMTISTLVTHKITHVTHLRIMSKWLRVGCSGGRPTITSRPRGASSVVSAVRSCLALTVSMMPSSVPAES
jgi:hypothetical protein